VHLFNTAELCIGILPRMVHSHARTKRHL
jgi:hypothetical protein